MVSSTSARRALPRLQARLQTLTVRPVVFLPERGNTLEKFTTLQGRNSREIFGTAGRGFDPNRASDSPPTPVFVPMKGQNSREFSERGVGTDCGFQRWPQEGGARSVGLGVQRWPRRGPALGA